MFLGNLDYFSDSVYCSERETTLVELLYNWYMDLPLIMFKIDYKGGVGGGY